MTRTLTLSLLVFSSLYSSDVNISTLNVESTLITDVAQNANTSADVAQALSVSVPSIDMNRRSGIANDILIRGQKRDNINVEVDGTKVYGACPNRMDPPVSHILANQIESIEVIEGPFDVTSFGVMSGGVKIQTKKPTKETKVELNVGVGSFNYKKFGASASGGTDTVRAIIAISTESSDQYKDGDGNTIADQIDNNAAQDPANLNGTKYQTQYRDMQAYTKKSAMAKVFVTTAKDQELRLSATANRSENILYGNSKMDALWDDSNIYSIEYNIANIGDTYQNVNLQYYHSDVDHPMSTKYRLSGAVDYATSHLTTGMDGIKLKNELQIGGHKILIGLDGSQRSWNGDYTLTNAATNVITPKGKSIDNALTTNSALFVKVNNSIGNFDVSVGARYDMTNITSQDPNQASRDFTAINANIVTTYNLNSSNKIFLGVGQASRVPDTRELYFRSIQNNYVGTQTLNQTTNKEVDLGYEAHTDSFDFKIKAFYSLLNDYIYYQKQENGVAITTNNFKNVDATVYGTELSSSYFINDDISLDLGVSYKRGTRNEALTGQTGTNMADMAPLRGSFALNYEYKNNSVASLSFHASDKWTDIDSENGEQELAAWNILNFKLKHAINKKFDFTLGANNIFDETYAVSNTYADLTLITSGNTDVMLMNEPGRYIYGNLDFKF